MVNPYSAGTLTLQESAKLRLAHYGLRLSGGVFQRSAPTALLDRALSVGMFQRT